jgi:endonuclease-3
MKKGAKAKIPFIIEEFDKLYPEAECSLNYDDPLQLLISTRLSAQCTDARVNMVTPALFERFPDCKAFAEADVSEIEEYIKSTGFYRAKAQNIKDASRMLVDNYSGVLPSDMDELLKFPGVGRKIANLLLGDIYKMPAIVCDTHCIRICGRIGLYPEKEKSAERVERVLRSLMDVTRGSDFCHRIVEFGREICSARSPRCDACPMTDICLHFEKNHKKI